MSVNKHHEYFVHQNSWCLFLIPNRCQESTGGEGSGRPAADRRTTSLLPTAVNPRDGQQFNRPDVCAAAMHRRLAARADDAAAVVSVGTVVERNQSFAPDTRLHRSPAGWRLPFDRQVGDGDAAVHGGLQSLQPGRWRRVRRGAGGPRILDRRVDARSN